MGLLTYIAQTVDQAISQDEKDMYFDILVDMAGVAIQSASRGAAEDRSIPVMRTVNHRDHNQPNDPTILALQPGGFLTGFKELTSHTCCCQSTSKMIRQEWDSMLPQMKIESRDTFLLVDVINFLLTVKCRRTKRKRGATHSVPFKTWLKECTVPLLQWIGKMVDRWV